MKIGDIDINPVSDGTFVASPGYFGARDDAGHEDMFDRHGKAWLPIGCFLIRSGDRLVLVDAGMGPTQWDDGTGRVQLVGGQLLVGLRALGVTPADIDDVVCTHLHSDHVGWLFDLDGKPIFDNATIWFGEHDWGHFVATEHPYMQEHIRHGFRSADAGRMQALTSERTISSGVDLLMAPGHTPGHLCVVVSSRGRRALLLGDAITCPVQLDEPSWHSMGDVDPALADRVRERLWRELEGEDVLGAGAHFPELQFGRVLAGRGRRWFT